MLGTGAIALDFVIENIRLRELVAIVNTNRAFFDDFRKFLQDRRYAVILDFIGEASDDKGREVIAEYLTYNSEAILYDGVGRPYANRKARWLFLSWLLRDAPAQRLDPLVRHMPGSNSVERKAFLLNELRNCVKLLFGRPESWEWPVIAEVMTARLEGSRRALKGNLFEAIVRRSLVTLFENNRISLRIGEGEIRINEETYDVQVYGEKEILLIPVKTRETMGGGHALLFTRDIHKSISVAEEAGHHCLPVVIAESWSGDLDGLPCEKYIYIQVNPNQIAQIEPLLMDALERLLDTFRDLL